jgi:hypothetical protein
MSDDDYIPFEGPLHKDRGPRKLTEAQAAQIADSVRKVRERQAARRAKTHAATTSPDRNGGSG